MHWSEKDEQRLRAEIPVYINCFEQLTYVRDTVDWFHDNGFGNVTVVDHNSTYPPLVDYLHSERFQQRAKVRFLGKNIGPRRAVKRCVQIAGIDEPIIFTDPDLELPSPAAGDFLTRMIHYARRYDVSKIGLALDIFDEERVNLQMDIGKGHTVGSYYKRFFRYPVEKNVYKTGIDTTFFMYVPRPAPVKADILSSQPRIPAIRLSGPGFLAGHRPWMFESGFPAEEERFYRDRTTVASTLFGRADDTQDTA